MSKETPPRFAIANGLRYDFDKATRVATGKGFVAMPEYGESTRPVLLKTPKGNYFALWENTDGDLDCFKALTKKAALRICADIDVLVAEKEFSDIIKEG